MPELNSVCQCHIKFWIYNGHKPLNVFCTLVDTLLVVTWADDILDIADLNTIGFGRPSSVDTFDTDICC